MNTIVLTIFFWLWIRRNSVSMLEKINFRRIPMTHLNEPLFGYKKWMNHSRYKKWMNHSGCKKSPSLMHHAQHYSLGLFHTPFLAYTGAKCPQIEYTKEKEIPVFLVPLNWAWLSMKSNGKFFFGSKLHISQRTMATHREIEKYIYFWQETGTHSLCTEKTIFPTDL